MKLSLNELKYIIAETYRNLLNEITVKDAYSTHYKDISEDVFNNIVSAMQGDNETLLPETKWVLGRYRKEGESMLNNLEVLADAMKLFIRAKRRQMLPQGKNNLNTYMNSEEFIREMNSLDKAAINKRTKGELSRDIKREKDNIDIVYEDDEWFVLIPKSYEASCHWGSGTQWCTASRETDNNFKWYSKNGSLYININKRTKEKYQFSLKHREFRDMHDNMINCPVMDSIGANEGLREFYKRLVQDERMLNILFNWKINFEDEFYEIGDDGRYIVHVVHNGKHYLIDDNFDLFVDLAFDDIIEIFTSSETAIVKLCGRYYIFDMDYNKDYDYDVDDFLLGGFSEISKFGDRNYAIVKKCGKYNTINKNGVVLNRMWFDKVEAINDIYHTYIDNVEYFIDIYGRAKKI